LSRRRKIVSLFVGKQVFGNVAYWFDQEDLTVSADAAESFLLAKGKANLRLPWFGEHVLFPEKSIRLLHQAGMVRLIP
jgi:hypothetical protein